MAPISTSFLGKRTSGEAIVGILNSDGNAMNGCREAMAIPTFAENRRL
jgi:hypothetical protein